MRRILILSLFFVITASNLFSQQAYNIGVLPEFNISAPLSTLWKLNAEVASRFETVTGRIGESARSNVSFSLVDVTTVASRTVGVDAHVGVGYLMRFRNSELIHRFIQQYAFTNPYYGYRLGHRFRIDETFAPARPLTVRLRYRLASDISLNGEFIDPKELYLKLGNEYVYANQDNQTDLEVRLVPALGYYFDDDHKLELGLDYRINSFLKSTAAHRFWLNVSYYLSL